MKEDSKHSESEKPHSSEKSV